MASFTWSDISNCLEHSEVAAQLKADPPVRLVSGWGDGGNHTGHEYEGWTGGFVVELKSGKYAYLQGWTDSTGWG